MAITKLEKLTRAVQLENLKKTRFYGKDDVNVADANAIIDKINEVIEEGVGGSNPTVDILIADLQTAILNSELIPDTIYRITDYQNVNLLHGIEGSTLIGSADLYTAPVEILLVQADAVNTLSKTAVSEDFPDDILYLDLTEESIISSANDDNYGGPPSGSYTGTLAIEFDGVLNKAYIDLASGVNLGGYLYIYFEADGGAIFYETEWDPIVTGIAETGDEFGDPSSITLANGGTRIYFDDFNTALVSDGDIEIYWDTELVSYTKGIVRRIDPNNKIDVATNWRFNKYRRYDYDMTPVFGSHIFTTGYIGHLPLLSARGETQVNLTESGLTVDYLMFGSITPDPAFFTDITIGVVDNFVAFNQARHVHIGNAVNLTVYSILFTDIQYSYSQRFFNYVETMQNDHYGLLMSSLIKASSWNNISQFKDTRCKTSITNNKIGALETNTFDGVVRGNTIGYMDRNNLSYTFEYNRISQFNRNISTGIVIIGHNSVGLFNDNTINCSFRRNVSARILTNVFNVGGTGVENNNINQISNNTFTLSGSFFNNGGTIWSDSNLTAVNISRNTFVEFDNITINAGSFTVCNGVYLRNTVFTNSVNYVNFGSQVTQSSFTGILYGITFEGDIVTLIVADTSVYPVLQSATENITIYSNQAGGGNHKGRYYDNATNVLTFINL